MELTDQQKQSIREWVGQDCGLSDIQKKLAAEFKISMTYMEVRLLVLELGLKLKEKKTFPPAGASNVTDSLAPEQPGTRSRTAEDRTAAAKTGTGGVSVAVDRVTMSGAIVSGSVTFSDGVTATWYVDQVGRLALKPRKPDYVPSKQDMQSFQQALQGEFAKLGF